MDILQNKFIKAVNTSFAAYNKKAEREALKN